MRTLLLNEIDQVDGGSALDVVAAVITIGQAVWDIGAHFAQDNGGPPAADWCASVGYNY
jgi:hypothetical protein